MQVDYLSASGDPTPLEPSGRIVVQFAGAPARTISVRSLALLMGEPDSWLEIERHLL